MDQIADKVCATMTDYNGLLSSREKDLVDIVVLAVTQNINGSALSLALEAEQRRRKMEPFKRIIVPPTWGKAISGKASLFHTAPISVRLSLQQISLHAWLTPRLPAGLEKEHGQHTIYDGNRH